MTNGPEQVKNWDFGDDTEDPIHRIHSYPARFPSFITTKALHYAESAGVNVGLVADVFCGCGTAAVESKRNGKDFWGCDINPLASLIARVKTHKYRDNTLEIYFQNIMKRYSSFVLSERHYTRINDRIRYWFEAHSIADLLRLDAAIRSETTPGTAHRSFFLCAFSNILKPTSRWLTKSIKPQLDPDKTPKDVLTVFADQVRFMRKANLSSQFPNPPPFVTISTRNFLSSPIPAIDVDLIVTSPPYVTSYDYADIHQLSTLWLRYATDYRTLRKHMVGNLYGVPPLEPTNIVELGPAVRRTLANLSTIDRRKAASVGRYFLDVKKAVEKCVKMLSKTGIAVFVIGNTRYQGVTIDNADYLVECMERAGLKRLDMVTRLVSRKTMTPYRDTLGRFTRDSSARRVYGEEYVVIGRKV